MVIMFVSYHYSNYEGDRLKAYFEGAVTGRFDDKYFFNIKSEKEFIRMHHNFKSARHRYSIAFLTLLNTGNCESPSIEYRFTSSS